MAKRLEIKVSIPIPDGDAFAEARLVSAAENPTSDLSKALIAAAGEGAGEPTVEVKVVTPPLKPRTRMKKSDTTQPRTARAA